MNKANKIKRKRNPNSALNKYAYIFIAPFLLVFLLFSLYPMVYSIILAFQNANYNNPGVTDSFSFVVHSRQFWLSFLNTLIIFAMNFIPQLVSALFFAVLFTSRKIKIKGKKFFRFVYFLPNILTATTVASMFILLTERTRVIDGEFFGGPIYEWFISMGMNPELKLNNDPWLTRILIAFIQFWMWFGNSMIVYISGIKGISDEVYEAADLDGASSWQIFTNITLPILKPIMLYSLITSVIGGLQMFDIPMMIHGGEVKTGFFAGLDSTKTIAIYIYEFMMNEDYSIAGAASIILFIFSLLLSILMYFLFFKEKNDEKRILKRLDAYEKK